MPRKTTAVNADFRVSLNTRTLIGRRIARRRMVLRMSQAALAEKFGVSRATLSHYEAGIGDLKAGDMSFLAQLLYVPVTYFFMDENNTDSSSRLEAVAAYFAALPIAYQKIILNTTKSTFLDLHGSDSGRDIRPGDEIEEFDKSGDEIVDLGEDSSKISTTK